MFKTNPVISVCSFGLKIQFFLDVMLFQWTSCSWCCKGI